MAKETGVEWTDGTWPIVQGCDPVSPGCAHCYAVPLLWRLMHNPNPVISGPLQGLVEKHKGKLRFTGKVAMREDRLSWPLQWKTPMKIFVPSHGDIFHKAVTEDQLDLIWAVMALCPQHTFQVLTKRPERMRDYFITRHSHNEIELAAERLQPSADTPFSPKHVFCWPLPNVWLGVSTEDQQRADERIPALLETPAAIRFISAEPLLGPIILHPLGDGTNALTSSVGPNLDWVIVGGESGPGARPGNITWLRSIRDQCAEVEVPVFIKQLGRRPYWDFCNGFGPWPKHVTFTRTKLDGCQIDAITLRDKKGGDWNEWPKDLRVRQFPTARTA